MTNKPKQTAADAIAELVSAAGPGPKMGLGGWGIPGIGPQEGLGNNLGVILGYCMEKIFVSFQTLRHLSLGGQDLMRSVRTLQTGRPGVGGSSGLSKKQKDARELIEKAKEAFKLNTPEALNFIREMTASTDLLQGATLDDRISLVAAFKTYLGKDPYPSLLLNVLRSADNKDEMRKLVEAAGGKEAIESHLTDASLGAFFCLMEDFEQSPWQAPFFHFIFSEPLEGKSKGKASLASTFKAAVTVPGEDTLVTEEYMERFLNGACTASDIMALSRDELYLMAKRGFDLISQGQLDAVLRIFDGLVYLDPTDPYFYTLLGSIRQKLNDTEGAIRCYDIAIRLQPWNLAAYANRGEIFYNQGKLTEALQDFHRVVLLDPEDKNTSTPRVKLMVLAVSQAIQGATAPQTGAGA